MHIHHIKPRHMGGTDDPSNLIKLTVAEHAEAHRVLFEQYGCWQDRLAWRGLAGLITHEEAAREVSRQNGLKNKGKKYHLGFKHPPSFFIKMKGVPKSEEHKKALRGLRPHVNQTGAVNNNAHPINTPYGVFGSISEFIKAHGNEIPFKEKYYYVNKMINKGIDNWSKL